MGLYQDQLNSLSELKRLAVLVMDDSRRSEIGADQWPLAMVAYGLVTCNDDSRVAEGIEVYKTFSDFCAPDVRSRCILQLAEFIRQRQGNGWRALLPFALADDEPHNRRQAAFLIGTLAAPVEGNPYAGFDALARLVCQPPLPGQQHNAPLLDALLGTADQRFTPLADYIREHLSAPKLATLLESSSMQPNALSCEWLLNTLATHPELSSAITKVLVDSAGRADEILDVIVPIPSWLFKDASVQSLHGWTRPEYFERMKGRLSQLLNEQELEQVHEAWQA